jgi:AcrR family transcriptional regulator
VKEEHMARAKSRAVREPLSRERIEETALELIEREGEGGFSMRKLAAELGCEAMSIYHYFPSLAHLRDALLDRFVAGMFRAPRDLPWLERLRQVTHGYREAVLRHPRFFQYVALHRMNTAAGLDLLEHFLAIFKDAGFDTETAARLFRAVGYYLLGAGLEEAAGYAKGPSAVEPVPDEVAARDYPLITAVNPYFRPAEREETFRVGLEIMFDGIARAHREMRRGRHPPKSGSVSRRRAERQAPPSRSSSRS